MQIIVRFKEDQEITFLTEDMKELPDCLHFISQLFGHKIREVKPKATKPRVKADAIPPQEDPAEKKTRGKSYTKSIIEIMKKKGEAMHASDIVTELKEIGIVKNANQVNRVMRQSKKFERIGAAFYRLAQP